MIKLFLFVVIIFSLALSVSAQECQSGEKRQCGYSNQGECKYGTQFCNFGQWTLCFGSQGPVTEVCGDGKDNDCDGDVDEQCACQSGETRSCGQTDEGVCAYGTQTCEDGSWSSCVGEVTALLNEICSNALDDDCDGQVDDGCPTENETQQQNTSCFNGIQDGNETGVDCGGSCRTCSSCTDGVLNQGETRVQADLGNGTVSDCGGLYCPACPSCYDGQQNQGEEALDCGGPCRACASVGEEDLDADGLSVTLELQRGTDPHNPNTDGDDILDGQDRMPLCPNTFCDAQYGEDATTCPEDCAVEPKLSLTWIVVLLLVLLLCVGAYFYFQFKKGTKKISDVFWKPQKQEKKLVFDASQYGAVSKKDERKSNVEQALEKSLEKAEKFFKK